MPNNRLKNLATVVLILGFILASFLVVRAQEVPELSTDVVKMIPEKDLVEVFCLTTRYKTGVVFRRFRWIGRSFSSGPKRPSSNRNGG